MPQDLKELTVLIRGAGEMASGVALRLVNSGFKVVLSEAPQPLAVRRAVSFAIRFSARGDPALVREFLRQHAGSDDEATVWTLCDAIRSMTKSLLPEFVALLPVYEAWQEKLTGKARRSVESAVKTLRSVQR